MTSKEEYNMDTGLGLFRCVARTELKEKEPAVSDTVLLYLNHAITEAYKLGAASSPPTYAQGQEEMRERAAKAALALENGILEQGATARVIAADIRTLPIKEVE